MRSRRSRLIAALVAAVLIGGGLLVARQIKGEVVLLQQCGTIQQQVRERGDVLHVSGHPPAIFIIGDSYASGDTLADYHDAWSFDLAHDTRRAVDIAAIGRTGFVDGGFCGGATFGSRATAALNAKPEVLIIQEGSDDGYPPASVEAAARATLQRVSSIPQVIVLGALPVPENPNVSEIDAALERAASDSGARFVSTASWRIEIGADGAHPTSAGAAEYARLVARALASSSDEHD